MLQSKQRLCINYSVSQNYFTSQTPLSQNVGILQKFPGWKNRQPPTLHRLISYYWGKKKILQVGSSKNLGRLTFWFIFSNIFWANTYYVSGSEIHRRWYISESKKYQRLLVHVRSCLLWKGSGRSDIIYLFGSTVRGQMNCEYWNQKK